MKKPAPPVLGLFFMVLLITEASWAFGPVQTKREREKNAPSASAVPAPRPMASYEKIQENFLKENYTAVQSLSEEYLRGPQNPPHAADEIRYLKALSLLKLGRGEEARQIWRALQAKEATAEERVFARSAAISIADSYYFEARKDLAYQSYKAALSHFPDSEETEYAQKRLAELKSYAPAFSPLKQMAMEEAPAYSVQVGSFSKQSNAEELVKHLSRSRFEVRIDSNPTDHLYRVRVGKFASREEASAVQVRLKREGYSTQIVP